MSEQYLMANGLRLCYEEFGDKQNPSIVLIMGLGTQMVSWPDAFCDMLADLGFHVVRFDNRDIGLSEKIAVSQPVNLIRQALRQRLGLAIRAPYTLNDMAIDTIALLDALNIDKAHWVGASMGGMIAQVLAAEHPSRTLTLTSIMSTTGKRNLPQAPLKVLKQMLTRPSVDDETAYLKHAIKTWRLIGSPAYPPSDEDLKERILRSARRSYYPAGYRNQAAAIMASGDRRGLIRRIKCPTLIIHGKADILVPVEGGIDTAKNIKHANLQLIEGMGHDLPKELLPRFTQMIGELIDSTSSEQALAASA